MDELVFMEMEVGSEGVDGDVSFVEHALLRLCYVHSHPSKQRLLLWRLSVFGYELVYEIVKLSAFVKLGWVKLCLNYHLLYQLIKHSPSLYLG